MGLFHYLWSRTAASNDSIDANINWAEGMPPSAVNNSGRAMMAASAGFRDDISGAIVTTNTSTAYNVTSYQIFDSLAHMNGMQIAFTPHTTNGATVTLNVDGLGAKPLRSSPSVELPAGVLIQGTPYVATYNNSDAVWYLQNFYGNPYNIPLAAGMDFWGSTAPNSSFVFPFGQAISRTTYSALFSLVSTTYGVGDGSTTFNIPDLRGRVTAGKDDMGGSAAGMFTGVSFASGNATTLGSKVGIVTQTIGQSNLPNVTLAYSNSISVTSADSVVKGGSVAGALNGTGIPYNTISNPASVGATTSTGTSSGNTASINGGVTQTALPTVQPTIICNRIMRII